MILDTSQAPGESCGVGSLASMEPADMAAIRQFALSWSRILSTPARAQASSRLPPGAPAAPTAPITSSPRLMTTPPPNRMRCGSWVNSAAMPGVVLARSANAAVSALNEAAV